MANPIEIKVTQTGGQATASALEKIGETAVIIMKHAEEAAVATTAAASTAATAVAKVFDQAAAAAQAAEYRLKALARQQQQTAAQAGEQSRMAGKPLPLGSMALGAKAATASDVVGIPPKIEEVTAKLDKQKTSAVEAGRGMRQMVDAVFSLAGVQSPLAGRIQQASVAMNSMAEGAGVAAEVMGPLAVGIGIVAAGAVALAAVMFKVAESTAAFSDSQGKQAEKLGVTVEEFSRLSFAAKLSNVSTAQLTNGLAHLSAEAVKNSEAFQLLGITTKKANGEQRNAAEMLIEVAAKFASYEDGITKTRLAQQLFGVGLGKELLPLLNLGSDGISKLSDEIERYGGVTTDAEAKAAGRFNDSLTRLSTIAESVWHIFGNALIPAFANLLEHAVALVGGVGNLKVAFDIFVGPLNVVSEAFDGLTFSARIATAVISGNYQAIKAYASGDMAAAQQAIDGIGASLKKLNAERGFSKEPLGPSAPKPQAPALDTEEEKRERKRVDSIYQIRAKGEADLAALLEKGDRQAIDASYKADEISAEKYYAARRDLIDRDLDLQLQNLRIRVASEEDAEKKSAELTAGENLALEQKRVSLAALGIEQAADLRRTQEKLDREQKTADALQRRYEVHRQEMPLHEIEAQMAAVQADRTLTAAERRAQIGTLLQKELAMMPALIAAAQEEANSSDLGERIRGEEKLVRLQSERLQKISQLNNLPPDTFFQRFNTGLDGLAEKWGNFGANLADDLTGSLSSTMDGFGDKVLDVASGVKSIGELGIASLRQLTSSLITTVAQWVVQMTVVRALQKVFNMEQKAEAIERTAVLAPGAAMASVGSFGTAAVVGGLALAAVLAMALAFETGGRVKGGEQLIRVNERGEEMVINAPGTQRWAGLLEQINAGATTAAQLRPHLPSPDYEAMAGQQAAVAGVSGRTAGAAMPAINVPDPRVEIHVVNTQREVQRVINSRPGRNTIVKHVRNSRGAQGFEEA